LSHDYASIDSDEQALGTGKTQVELWLSKIELAREEEKDWRTSAEKAVKIYNGKEKTAFNIFFSNIETIVPALYSATPKVDIRRRFQDEAELDRMNALNGAQPAQQPVPGAAPVNDRQPSRIAAQVLERALTATLDMIAFDDIMLEAVRSHKTPGRGAVRVRYQPFHDQQNMQTDPTTGEHFAPLVHEECYPENVPYNRYIRGPANTWSAMPFEAYEHDLKREEVQRLVERSIATATHDPNAPVVPVVPVADPKAALEERMKKFSFGTKRTDITETKDGKPARGVYNTIKVYEIWDKASRSCFFISDQDKTQPLLVEPDPLKLRDFFPGEVIQQSEVGSLVPICPYEICKPLMQELERVTKRITALTNQLQVKGVANGAAMPDIARLKDMSDGEFVAAEDVSEFLKGGGANFEKAVMWWPIERIVAVLDALYKHREAIKQTIFEQTGISDILRGATNPNETLGAQDIKATWGSQRVRREQAQVQMFIRNIIRKLADILSSKFQVSTLVAMTNIQFQEGDEVAKILRSPMLDYIIDIETDSTIAADVKRDLGQMAQFTNSAGAMLQAMMTAAPIAPQFMPALTTVFTGMCRKAKLGKDAEDALDGMIDAARQMAQQAQQAQQPDPAQQQAEQKAADAESAKSEAVKVKADADKFKAQASIEVAQLKSQQARSQVGNVQGSPFPPQLEEVLN